MGVLSRLGRSPIFTASSQAGLLMCVGDLISQKFVENKDARSIDLYRTARFGLVGFIVVGPVLRTWYGFLERRIVMKTPAMTAVAKMATDQLIFAPIFLFNFMGLMGVLNGLNSRQIETDLRNNYGDVMLRNYQLWPAAQLINFGLVPLQHRVLFAQCVAVFWNTYLSFKTNR